MRFKDADGRWRGAPGKGQDEARRAPGSPRTREARAPAARRPCAERRQPPAHLRRAHELVAGGLPGAGAGADEQAPFREAPAAPPRQTAPPRRRRPPSPPPPPPERGALPP